MITLHHHTTHIHFSRNGVLFYRLPLLIARRMLPTLDRYYLWFTDEMKEYILKHLNNNT